MEQGGGIAPAGSITATAKADYGAVIFSWPVPEDENLYYVNISWTDAEGQPRSLQVSKFAADASSAQVSVVADGFTDTTTYLFTLTPYNSAGAAGPSSQITCAPLEPAYNIVLPTVTLTPDFGGVMINWENKTGKDLTIEIEYMLEDGSKQSKSINAKSSIQEGNDAIAGFTQGAEHPFTVSIKDRFEHRSEEKIINQEVLQEQKIDKSIWDIPGYNADSNQGTIGYSSQAINEDKDGRINRARAIFDNDVNSFWHARWSDTDYPHWYIVDLGKEVIISRIEMTRRQGNAKGQKGQQIFTCTAAGRTAADNNLNGTDGWQWEDHGEFPFNIAIDDAQSCRLKANPAARYVKVLFTQEHKGEDKFAMVGEMSVYGMED